MGLTGGRAALALLLQLAASGFDAFADGTHLIVGGAWGFLRAIAALRRHGWRCLPAGLLYRRDGLRLRRLRRGKGWLLYTF
ncbi:hypothetical protein NY96_28165, partial [Xanthomonas citri pv. fuscans]